MSFEFFAGWLIGMGGPGVAWAYRTHHQAFAVALVVAMFVVVLLRVVVLDRSQTSAPNLGREDTT